VKLAEPTPAALEKRAQPGRVRAILLALTVHALFFGFIVVGVSWQSSPTAPIEAEIWDKLPPVAAKPAPEPPKPEPEPPKPEPPKPEPPKPDVKPEPPKPDPEIALKAEREKRLLEKKKKDDEAKKKRDELEAAKKKREQEEAAKKKLADDKRRRDEEAARKEAEKARAAAEDARRKEIGTYIDKIRAKIRSRANVPDTVTGRPSVQMQIRILPGGDVLDIRVLKPSGNRAYDAAIERAIRSAQPLPVPDANTELFPQFRDLILNIEHDR